MGKIKTFKNFKDAPTWKKVTWISLTLLTVVFLIFFPHLTLQAFELVGDLLEQMMPRVEVNAILIKDVPVSEMFSLKLTKGFHLPQISYESAESAIASLDIGLPFLLVVVLVFLTAFVVSVKTPGFPRIFLLLFALWQIVCTPVLIGIYDHLILAQIRPFLAGLVFHVLVYLGLAFSLMLGHLCDNYQSALNGLVVEQNWKMRRAAAAEAKGEELPVTTDDKTMAQKKREAVRTAIKDAAELVFIGYLIVYFLFVMVEPSAAFVYTCIAFVLLMALLSVSTAADSRKYRLKTQDKIDEAKELQKKNFDRKSQKIVEKANKTLQKATKKVEKATKKVEEATKRVQLVNEKTKKRNDLLSGV